MAKTYSGQPLTLIGDVLPRSSQGRKMAIICQLTKVAYPLYGAFPVAAYGGGFNWRGNLGRRQEPVGPGPRTTVRFGGERYERTLNPPLDLLPFTVRRPTPLCARPSTPKRCSTIRTYQGTATERLLLNQDMVRTLGKILRTLGSKLKAVRRASLHLATTRCRRIGLRPYLPFYSDFTALALPLKRCLP